MIVTNDRGEPRLVELCRTANTGPQPHDTIVFREVRDRRTGAVSPDDECWFLIARPNVARPGKLVNLGEFIVLIDDTDGSPYLNDLLVELSIPQGGLSLLRWLFDELSLWGELQGQARDSGRLTRRRTAAQILAAPPRAPVEILGGGQLEVFRLLGELHPYLWPADKFMAWSAESRASAS